jgi:hypothetical protein
MEQTTPWLLGDAFVGLLIVRRVWSGLMLLTLPAVFYFLANSIAIECNTVHRDQPMSLFSDPAS